MASCMTLAKPSYPSWILLALKMVVIAEAHLEQSSDLTIVKKANTTIPIESFMMNDDKTVEIGTQMESEIHLDYFLVFCIAY